MHLFQFLCSFDVVLYFFYCCGAISSTLITLRNIRIFPCAPSLRRCGCSESGQGWAGGGCVPCGGHWVFQLQIHRRPPLQRIKRARRCNGWINADCVAGLRQVAHGDLRILRREESINNTLSVTIGIRVASKRIHQFLVIRRRATSATLDKVIEHAVGPWVGSPRTPGSLDRVANGQLLPGNVR